MPLRFGHRAHKVGYGKVGNEKDARVIASLAVMVGGYYAEGASDFILRLNAEEQL